MMIQARAGSSKTTVIVEGTKYLPSSKNVLMCAFNKRIQEELSNRVSRSAEIRTLHSLGYRMLQNEFGSLKMDSSFNANNALVGAILARHGRPKKGRELYMVNRLVSIAKNSLATDHEHLAELAYEFDVEDRNFTAEQISEIALDVMNEWSDDPTTILFDDMIWMPYVYDLSGHKHDWVLVDEAQDINAAQKWLIDTHIVERGKLVVVGDDRQAIYSFRGVLPESMSQLMGKRKHKVYSLPISYRCPKKVVELAQKYVPDFQQWEDADDGVIGDASLDMLYEGVLPGDFVLSRTNAPLMRICLECLTRGYRVTIAGKDFGVKMIRLIKQSRTQDTAALVRWLQSWLDMESERLTSLKKEWKIKYIEDQVEALTVLAELDRSCDMLKNRLELLFGDDSSQDRITLSTVHKAKGLERDRVWLLDDTFAKVRGIRGANMAEEDNVYYVALTRAKQELHFVRGTVS